MRVTAGDTIVVLRAVKIAPGSIFHIRPGDVGVVDRVDESECTATFHGLTVVVSLDVVQPLST